MQRSTRSLIDILGFISRIHIIVINKSKDLTSKRLIQLIGEKGGEFADFRDTVLASRKRLMLTQMLFAFIPLIMMCVGTCGAVLQSDSVEAFGYLLFGGFFLFFFSIPILIWTSLKACPIGRAYHMYLRWYKDKFDEMDYKGRRYDPYLKCEEISDGEILALYREIKNSNHNSVKTVDIERQKIMAVKEYHKYGVIKDGSKYDPQIMRWMVEYGYDRKAMR